MDQIGFFAAKFSFYLNLHKKIVEKLCLYEYFICTNILFR